MRRLSNATVSVVSHWRISTWEKGFLDRTSSIMEACELFDKSLLADSHVGQSIKLFLFS